MTRNQLKQACAAHKARKAHRDAAAKAERLTVNVQYWIETAREDERDLGPYRLCTDGGQRFALSATEAILAQKQGLPFKAL